MCEAQILGSLKKSSSTDFIFGTLFETGTKKSYLYLKYSNYEKNNFGI